MADPKPRQIIKLKVATSGLAPADPDPSASGKTPKLKLKIGNLSGGAPKDSASADAAPSPKIKLSKPKKDKPAGLDMGKKRGQSAATKDGAAGSGRIKKIKFSQSKKTPTTPYVKIKSKGRPPPRPPGVGYDSEASDREVDPAIEEQFILRMQPGEDCEYLRQAITEGRWGKEGADVRLKFLQADGRRAVVTIRGRIYAAALVDMPCIVEGMKSWDKKAWYKSADICQMLLVLGIVSTETDALTHPLPREVDKVSWQYAHGMTPPLRWARKRRFRKRISAHTIEEVENEVERLLRMDEESVGNVKYELIRRDDLDRANRGESEMDEDMEGNGNDYGVEDGDIELADYFGEDRIITAEGVEEQEDDMAADFEAALENDMAVEPSEATALVEVQTSAAAVTSGPAVIDTVELAAASESEEASTPAPGVTSREESGDDEEDEDEDEDEESDADDEEREKRADLQRQLDEIADLESAIQSQKEERTRMQNPILRKKIDNKIKSLEDDVELKKAAIGQEIED